MQTASETLESEGIEPEHIETVLDAIAETTRDLFETYEVELDPEEPVLEAVQDATLRAVIELGQEADDHTVVEQFELLRLDFNNTDSPSARSNLIWVLGCAHHENELDALTELSEAIVAQNYSEA